MSSVTRIREYIDSKRIKKSEFYLKTKLSNGYLDKVKELGADKLESILNAYPDINIEWVITGKGDPERKTPTENGNNAPDHATENVKSGAIKRPFVTDSVTNPSQTGHLKGSKLSKRYNAEPNTPVFVDEQNIPYGSQCQVCLTKDEKIKDQAQVIKALTGQVEALKLATSQMKARLEPPSHTKAKK